MESTVASPVRTRLRVAKPSHSGCVSVRLMLLAPYMSLSAFKGRVVVLLNRLAPVRPTASTLGPHPALALRSS